MLKQSPMPSNRFVNQLACIGCGTLLAAWAAVAGASAAPLHDAIDGEAKAIEARMIGWRRDIHQHPELGNREHRTSRLVADHLKRLGYDVREKVAHTGVVATLQGGKPGPVVALRADMDALPVTEEVDLPFASRIKAMWRGKETGVMHACGHDAHTAILMAAAEVFAKMRTELPGTVKLIFQPAEEGVPEGEDGGARQMLKEGAFESPKPDIVLGLHVVTTRKVGQLSYRAGPTLAGSDMFRITIKGKQTHAAFPWRGTDPIVIGAHVVLALQTITSRQVDVLNEASVLTVGIFNGGNRANIIPETVELEGTLRTFSTDTRNFIAKRVSETAEAIARSAGAEAKVEWSNADNIVPLVSNADLARQILPSLHRVAGRENVFEAPRVVATDDFAFMAQAVPGLYFYVGITAPDTPPGRVAPNHSPRFFLDEAGLITGLRALTHATVDYMADAAK